MKPSPFETLGLKTNASQDEIKNAYRKLAKKLHPDLNPGNSEAEKRFKEINSAYEMIGTPEARKKFEQGEIERPQSEQAYASGGAYQRQGPYYHQTQGQNSRYSQSFGSSNEDIFESFFGGGRGAGAHAGFDLQGQDETYQMEIDFKDSILGAEKEISLPNGKRLRVKIPPGIDSGKKLRFAAQGGPGIGKAPAGDLYVEIKVRPSSVYQRSGKNIEMKIPISLTEAVLGAEVKVPTLDGSVLLKIPAGVSSGARLRIAGKGVAGRTPEESGDLLVGIRIVLPPSIDADFKAAVEAWSKRQPFHPRGENTKD